MSLSFPPKISTIHHQPDIETMPSDWKPDGPVFLWRGLAFFFFVVVIFSTSTRQKRPPFVLSQLLLRAGKHLLLRNLHLKGSAGKGVVVRSRPCVGSAVGAGRGGGGAGPSPGSGPDAGSVRAVVGGGGWRAFSAGSLLRHF